VHRGLAVAAASLVAVLSVAVAGCGGDDQSGAEQWADSVCTDLNTWADSITTTITSVMSQGLGVSSSDLSAAANQASSATSRHRNSCAIRAHQRIMTVRHWQY